MKGGRETSRSVSGALYSYRRKDADEYAKNLTPHLARTGGGGGAITFRTAHLSVLDLLSCGSHAVHISFHVAVGSHYEKNDARESAKRFVG